MMTLLHLFKRLSLNRQVEVAQPSSLLYGKVIAHVSNLVSAKFLRLRKVS